MDHRMGAGRRTARCAAVSLALAVVLAGCGGDGEPKTGQSSSPSSKASPTKTVTFGELKPIATMPLQHKDGPAHVDLLALSRTAADTVTARFKIINDGDDPIDLATSLSENGHALDPNLGDALSASGIGLLDARRATMYFPLQTTDTTENCVCTWLHNNPVNPGDYINVYATFPSPPADLERATIVFPFSVPFQDVPITSQPVEPLDTQIDPTEVELAQPRVLDVRNLIEGTEQSVADDADSRSVRLSADVLFAVNKANLTSRADQLLQLLAEQIDASGGDTVKVDGHADNTGNDEINQPLSQRRAKAVVDRLKSLVTREEVTYEAAGHGSKQPVATNDTKAGRRKNRRVTVTFARPPAPAPPPVSGEPYTWRSSPVLGSGTFEASAAEGLKVEVNSLHRDSSGLTILVWTLRNTGEDSPDVGVKFEKSAYLHGADPDPMRLLSAGGVMLYDKANEVRYNSLSLTTGPCVCSRVGDNDARVVIGPGESIVYWNAYLPPANATNLEMQVPWDRGADAVVKGLTIA